MKNIIFFFIAIIIGCSPKTTDNIKSGNFSVDYKKEFQNATILEGMLTDVETNEPLIFASIAIYKDRVLVTGTETDFDGNFSINLLDAGVYTLEASYLGYQTLKMKEVEIKNHQTTSLKVQLGNGGDFVMGCGGGYIIPLIEQDNTTQGQTLSTQQIRARRN